MKKLELLAPAGNQESLIAAINSGADAVYLGLGDFNARGNIENFNFENLKLCVQRAHLFGVKVYLTLNILFLDNEIDDVIILTKKAIEAKVDAFIVQDIGIAYLLKNKYPKIELHASTQMGVSNLEGAKFLKSVGFKRIVLARETSLEEIKRIKDNLDIELEYFIQGALCVSYSGNCYLCSLYANASGNRGRCKQFCRLPFKMENGVAKKEGYLLSTKDFCMLPKLKELAESGITSFKIEGRARRPAYVAGSVKVYRDAIDNNFSYNEKSINILKRLFNRGDYIAGYLNNENVIYNKTQNHIGVFVGKVLSFKKGKKFNEVTISSSHDLTKGDALKFFVNDKEECSVSVQDVKNLGANKYLFTTTSIIPENSLVRLIVDQSLENQLLNLNRTIKVRGEFKAKLGEKPKLTLLADNIKVEAFGDFDLQEAKSSPLSKDDCLMQISRMGELFSLENLEIDIENVFMAKSQLNKLRRDALEKLKEKIIQENENKLNIEEKEFEIKNKNRTKEINKKIIYFNSLKTLEKYIENKDYLVFNPDEYNLKEIKEFCENYKEKMIYLSLPTILIEKEINLLKELFALNSNLGVVANNYYALCLTTPEKTIIGSEMNVANSYAVEFYENLGFTKIILTKENFDIQNIQSKNAELFVESKFRKSLMHFRHCPFKENLGGNCKDCKYQLGSKMILNDKKFLLLRKRLCTCQFELVEEEPSSSSNHKFGRVVEIIDQ